MQTKVSPVFQVFERQHTEAKALFLVLGKQIKSKKCIELLGKMEFLELYCKMLGKIHFEQEGLEFDIFSSFKRLEKYLRKVHHLKLVERNFLEQERKTKQSYKSYCQHLTKQKKKLYNDTFDLVVGSSLKNWEHLFIEALQASKGLKPLEISSAIHQVINEELGFLQLEMKANLDSNALKETFDALKTIIMLENLLIHLGFNPIFVESIHGEIKALKDSLKPWYSNQLSLQSLTHFVAEKEAPSQKYLDWIIELKSQKKVLFSQAEKQAHQLFSKILV
ncbi:hypothetical protein [Algoriphagus machipongonensis]|uniref:Uncharacterized protein n=1 Tax=Algoriphagus machipongonensis TaxID=388413 RepID=A3HW87_9BACT|nr:hypothetical protein [Algoriphagus machipongonensis]EAZ80860.1 hypothetical protein ALPR1_17528 [Algoriphagus machipongonensis]